MLLVERPLIQLQLLELNTVDEESSREEMISRDNLLLGDSFNENSI